MSSVTSSCGKHSGASRSLFRRSYDTIYCLTYNSWRKYSVRVIQSFGSKETDDLFHYHHSRRFRSIERVALRKLLQLRAATELRVLASPPGNQWKHCEAIGKGSTRFGSMINGESVLSGVRAIATMSKSSTITSGKKRQI